MTLADAAPFRSLHIAIALTFGVVVALACAAPTPQPPVVVPASPATARCLPGPGDLVEQPVPDERGGYFVAAEVTAVRELVVSALEVSVELCVVGGARIGVRTLSIIDSVGHISHGWHLGERVLVHVTPGRIDECRVPRGTSMLYVECSGQP